MTCIPQFEDTVCKTKFSTWKMNNGECFCVNSDVLKYSVAMSVHVKTGSRPLVQTLWSWSHVPGWNFQPFTHIVFSYICLIKTGSFRCVSLFLWVLQFLMSKYPLLFVNVCMYVCACVGACVRAVCLVFKYFCFLGSFFVLCFMHSGLGLSVGLPVCPFVYLSVCLHAHPQFGRQKDRQLHR